MAKTKDGAPVAHDVLIHTKSLSLGATSAGLSYSVDRTLIDAEKAIALLVGARLRVTITQTPDDPDQKELVSSALQLVGAVADHKRLSIGTTSMTGRLSFNLDDVDLELLSAMRNRAVKLTAERTGDIADDED